ncbi:MAG: ABC transporter [Bacillota bacterium]|nr:MAG: ABC transporter [Bacillota bacterium]
MTIFRFALMRGLRKKSMFAALFAVPLAMIFIRPLWTPENGAGFVFYGMVILFAAFSLVRLIMTDRVSGTIVRIFAAPVTTFQYLSQNLLAYWLILGIQTVVMVAVGAMLYEWGIEMAAQLILCYTVFAVASIALSLAWTSLFRSKVISDAVFSIVVSFMALLGGIFIPLSMLPDILRKIGMLFPTYWFSNSLLGIRDGAASREYWLSLLIMLLLSAASLLYGSKRRLE